jgi:hypothetical protein
LLYEMLSGRRAFAKGSAIETMAAIVRDEPSPLDLPSQLSAVVTRCLRKAPTDRFQNITEAKKSLGANRGEIRTRKAATIHRRAPRRQHELRQGERILQRRPGRRDPEPAGEDFEPEGDRPHPNYAPAYSRLAAYYVALAAILVKPTGEVAPFAKAAAQKALALDPVNTEAHGVLANVAALSDYDWNWPTRISAKPWRRRPSRRR